MDVETGRYFTGRFYEYREEYIWTREISDAKKYVTVNEFIDEVEVEKESEFNNVESCFDSKVLEVKEILIFKETE